MKKLIELNGVEKRFSSGNGVLPVLKGVDLSVERGEFVTVVGSSGSGKSTLMNIIGCLDTPDSGSYLLDGEEVSALSEYQLSMVRNRKIGFIFQSFHLIPCLTALENVELPLRYRGMNARRRKELAEKALFEVGLSHRMNHLPNQLSGGQQQRVAIARAVAADPPVLLADEPTGNLDSESGYEVMKLLHRMHENGSTVILITHDPAVAAAAPRRIRFADGKILCEEFTAQYRP